MSMTQVEFLAKIKRYLAADSASPSISSINDATFVGWANDKIPLVVEKIDPIHCQALHVIGAAVTFTSGVYALSGLTYAYQKYLALKTGSSDRRTKIYDSADDFAMWDSSSFVFTPTAYIPVALIANGNIYVKPTTITAGKLDYIRQHQTMDTTHGTQFDDVADQLLLELVKQEALKWLEGEE